jgi:hypothetical protein
VLFGRSAQRQLSVVGHYSDGVMRNITASSAGTVYESSNDGVVSVTTEGLLLAEGSGIATVVAQNSGVQDSITVTVHFDAPPIAIPGADLTLTCAAPGSLVPVHLDGSASFDPDGDPLSFDWSEAGSQLASGPTPTVQLVPGDHTIELEVADGLGGVGDATQHVSILTDNAPPILTVLGRNPATVECGTAYVDNGASATDACDGDLTGAVITHSDVNPKQPGAYSVSYEVSDRVGLTAMADRSVIVIDSLPPAIEDKPETVLFPSTLEYRAFDLTDCAKAVDACHGRLDIDKFGEIVDISSDEPDSRRSGDRHDHGYDGDDPRRDIVILSNSSFLLRQQALEHGNGRVYEIRYRVRDKHDGPTSGLHSCFVGVKANKHSPPPIDDGRVFTVRPH